MTGEYPWLIDEIVRECSREKEQKGRKQKIVSSDLNLDRQRRKRELFCDCLHVQKLLYIIL